MDGDCAYLCGIRLKGFNNCVYLITITILKIYSENTFHWRWLCIILKVSIYTKKHITLLLHSLLHSSGSLTWISKHCTCAKRQTKNIVLFASLHMWLRCLQLSIRHYYHALNANYIIKYILPWDRIWSVIHPIIDFSIAE